MKSDTDKRLSYVIGQLKGIQKMSNNNRDIIEVIQQLQASKNAISSLLVTLVEKELCHEHQDKKVKGLIKSLIQ